MTARQLLVVGDESLYSGDRLVEAVNMAGAVAALECDPATALARLRRRPSAVVVDATMPGARTFVANMRADAQLASCAVVAVVPQATDAAFAEALAWGVDEVVPTASLGTLTEIARALEHHDPAGRPPATLGLVLVAAAAPDERLTRARPLRNVGYEVVFAADQRELAAQLTRTDVAFAVVDAGLFPDGTQGFLPLFSGAGPAHPVVAVVPEHEVDALSVALHAEARARVLPRQSPPEDAIFLGNELMRPGMANVRASARLLHPTSVSFRLEGSAHGTYGVTYNIAREGLYVRSLVPPPSNSIVWLELCPPTLDGLVHLEATVVWTRRFGSSAGATSPAGFGVRITGGSERSLARWREGYARLLRGRVGVAEA